MRHAPSSHSPHPHVPSPLARSRSPHHVTRSTSTRSPTFCRGRRRSPSSPTPRRAASRCTPTRASRTSRSGCTSRSSWRGRPTRCCSSSAARTAPIRRCRRAVRKHGHSFVVAATSSGRFGLSSDCLRLLVPHASCPTEGQRSRHIRPNTQVPPHYMILTTDVGGEQRFASSVARRLETLGAITRGDRRGGHGMAADLVQFNLDTELGKTALALSLDAAAEKCAAPRRLHAAPLARRRVSSACTLACVLGCSCTRSSLRTLACLHHRRRASSSSPRVSFSLGQPTQQVRGVAAVGPRAQDAAVPPAERADAARPLRRRRRAEGGHALAEGAGGAHAARGAAEVRTQAARVDRRARCAAAARASSWPCARASNPGLVASDPGPPDGPTMVLLTRSRPVVGAAGSGRPRPAERATYGDCPKAPPVRSGVAFGKEGEAFGWEGAAKSLQVAMPLPVSPSLLTSPLTSPPISSPAADAAAQRRPQRDDGQRLLQHQQVPQSAARAAVWAAGDDTPLPLFKAHLGPRLWVVWPLLLRAVCHLSTPLTRVSPLTNPLPSLPLSPLSPSPVLTRQQNALFEYYTSVFKWVVMTARQQGKIDSGIELVDGESVANITDPEVIFKEPVRHTPRHAAPRHAAASHISHPRHPTTETSRGSRFVRCCCCCCRCRCCRSRLLLLAPAAAHPCRPPARFFAGLARSDAALHAHGRYGPLVRVGQRAHGGRHVASRLQEQPAGGYTPTPPSLCPPVPPVSPRPPPSPLTPLAPPTVRQGGGTGFWQQSRSARVVLATEVMNGIPRAPSQW